MTRRLDPTTRIFTPSVRMPDTEDLVRATVLFGVWDRPWRWEESFALGRPVVLRHPGDGTLEWLVEVTDVLAVPFESAVAFRDMLVARWDPSITDIHGEAPAPGFGVAWRSAPLRHLGVVCPADAEASPAWGTLDDLDEHWHAALTR